MFSISVKTTVFTVSRKSLHTACINLTSMFLYVVIFQQMTFFAVKSSPSMMGLTVKNIIAKKELIFFQRYWCSILYYFRTVSKRIGWFTGPLKNIHILI